MKIKKFLSVLSSLLAVSMVMSTAAVTTYAAGQTSVSDFIDLNEIREEIKNLPEPVNYTSYEYVQEKTVDFPSGQYVVCLPVTPMIMKGTFKNNNWCTPDGIPMTDVVDMDHIPAETVPDEAVFHFTKTSTGKYTIEQNGKYFNIVRSGVVQLTDTPQVINMERSSNTNDVSFRINAIGTGENKLFELQKYSENSFAVFGSSTDNYEHFFRLYKKVVKKSIQNDTTGLYEALKQGQYYTNFDSTMIYLLDAGLEYYNNAYNRQVEQETIDQLTIEINFIVDKYKAAMEMNKSNVFKKVTGYFDPKDYSYRTLRSSVNLSEVRSTVKEAEDYPWDGTDKILIDHLKSFVDSSAGLSDGYEFIPKRNGDTRNIAKNQFKFWFWGTNRQSTGLWGVPLTELAVFVQADKNDPLPSLYFTQHISRNYDMEIKLNRGINIIKVPKLYGDGWGTPTEPGGCFYLWNPYTEQEQSGNVKVYIEGADKIPLYTIGDDPKAFYKELEDYYNEYKEKYAGNYSKGVHGCHNVVEFNTKNSIITLTLERCYEGYIREGMEVDHTAQSWSDFLDYLLAFDGVKREEYENLNLHCKVNQPYAGAYATNEKICIQDNHWSASLIAGEYGWGFPHELGHCLDNTGRVYSEMTNNVWSMKYSLDRKKMDSLCIPKNPSELDILTVDDDQYLWTDENAGTWFSDLYMFWDMEVYYPGYWAKLDSMFRAGSCGNPQIDELLKNCSTKEKVAAYSSKIVGIDLTYYYHQYGYFLSASDNYLKAMKSMSLSKQQPKIWYYDTYSYYKEKKAASGTISLGAYNKTQKAFTIKVSADLDKDTLGYEILRDGVIVGFTWDNYFIDSKLTDSNNHTYTVNAYDYALNCYDSFTFNTNTANTYVAQVNGVNYQTLAAAINAASENGSVYITAPMLITSKININKTLAIIFEDPSFAAYIYGQTYRDNVFNISANAEVKFLTGTDAVIAFSSGYYRSAYSFFRMTDFSCVLFGDNIMFNDVYSTSNGALFNADKYAHISMINNTVELCRTRKDGLIYLANQATFDDYNGVYRYNVAEGSGSVVYSKDAQNTVWFSDTDMTYNSAVDRTIGGTITMMQGTLQIKSGTHIENNFSDIYNRNTAVYVSDTAKVLFCGDLSIPDIVNVKNAVSFENNVKGQINLRADSSVAKNGFVIGKGPSSSVMKVLSYANRLYGMDYTEDGIVLKEKKELSFNADISAAKIHLGQSVTVTGNAVGGTQPYKYAVYYKKADSTSWSTVQTLGSSNTATVTPAAPVEYRVRIKVKDAVGNTINKTFTVNVDRELKNKTTVSATSVLVGEKITVHGAASGGRGAYQYAVYYKIPGDKNWRKIKPYSSETDTLFVPAISGDYILRTKVMDESGNVANKDINIKVFKPALKNNSSLSANEFKYGDTITVTAEATGGTKPYQYACLYRKASSSAWVTVAAYGTEKSFSITPKVATDYVVRVKVKDADGNIMRKDMTLALKTDNN